MFCNKRLPLSDYQCREGDVKCADGRQCIWKPALCNEYIACNDGSDESEATCKGKNNTYEVSSKKGH